MTPLLVWLLICCLPYGNHVLAQATHRFDLDAFILVGHPILCDVTGKTCTRSGIWTDDINVLDISLSSKHDNGVDISDSHEKTFNMAGDGTQIECDPDSETCETEEEQEEKGTESAEEEEKTTRNPIRSYELPNGGILVCNDNTGGCSTESPLPSNDVTGNNGQIEASSGGGDQSIPDNQSQEEESTTRPQVESFGMENGSELRCNHTSGECATHFPPTPSSSQPKDKDDADEATTEKDISSKESTTESTVDVESTTTPEVQHFGLENGATLKCNHTTGECATHFPPTNSPSQDKEKDDTDEATTEKDISSNESTTESTADIESSTTPEVQHFGLENGATLKCNHTTGECATHFPPTASPAQDKDKESSSEESSAEKDDTSIEATTENKNSADIETTTRPEVQGFGLENGAELRCNHTSGDCTTSVPPDSSDKESSKGDDKEVANEENSKSEDNEEKKEVNKFALENGSELKCNSTSGDCTTTAPPGNSPDTKIKKAKVLKDRK